MFCCAKLTWHVIIGRQEIAILCQDLIEVILYPKSWFSCLLTLSITFFFLLIIYWLKHKRESNPSGRWFIVTFSLCFVGCLATSPPCKMKHHPLSFILEVLRLLIRIFLNKNNLGIEEVITSILKNEYISWDIQIKNRTSKFSGSHKILRKLY